LLANAINYTPAGGQIDVRWYRDGGWIAFEVEDNGIGIAKENQARVFERFFREDKARSREVGGTGLGLSIVKHLCQVFGGQVKLLSQLGKGSTFSIRLRAAESMHAPEFPSTTPPH
jgi:two-component system phosphate regulon sensor histidine kinase PhoR